MKVNHIGIIVKSVDREVQLYQRMGCRIVCDIDDKNQMNKVVIVRRDDSPDIELIEPINQYSTIINFKSGYHHICYEAEVGENIVKNFNEMKVGKIFTTPIVAPALNNRKVVFACLYNGNFVELIL